MTRQECMDKRGKLKEIREEIKKQRRKCSKAKAGWMGKSSGQTGGRI